MEMVKKLNLMPFNVPWSKYCQIYIFNFKICYRSTNGTTKPIRIKFRHLLDSNHGYLFNEIPNYLKLYLTRFQLLELMCQDLVEKFLYKKIQDQVSANVTYMFAFCVIGTILVWLFVWYQKISCKQNQCEF